MKFSTPEHSLAAIANGLSPQGHVFRGRYVGMLRSPKGKIKGLMLQIGSETLAIKLPKYLRSLLVRELMPGMALEVWAYPDESHWRGTNVIPCMTLPEAAEPISPPEIALPRDHPPAPKAVKRAGDRPQDTLRLQICTKGKCFKSGGKQILQTLQAEVAANPHLQHVDIEAVGCLKACKSAPNLRLKPTGKLLPRMTPTAAMEWLAQCQ